jgi:putative hemolysin
MNVLLLLPLLLSLLATAYLSAVEIALISADRLKLRQEAKDGNAGARLALDLLADKERMLATTLVGCTLANLLTAALATSIFQALLPHWADWKVSLLTTGLVTLVILIAAEIVPKVYARPRADRFLTSMARPILATEQLFLPATALVRAYLSIWMRLLRRAPRSPLVTREDLKYLVHDIKGETGPGRKERKMLRSILDFGETTVREVMVPMTEVVSLERRAGTDLLRALIKRHGFTRLPVYERRVDRVVGLVNVYDLLFDPDPKEAIEPYIRPAILVPETKRIDRLLLELQRARAAMAVVVSEFGSCVGIITVEDIVEEIVGELAGEQDIGVRKIRPVGPGTYVVDALTDIDDINEDLGLELPKGRYDTVGGLVLKRFGRIPLEGEWFEIQGVRLEVMDVHPFGIRAVKLVLPQALPGAKGAAQAPDEA